MFVQESGGPQTGAGFTTSAVNQQSTQLLGTPQNQFGGMPMGGMPTFDPESLNTTQFQSLPEVTNMIKALKGGSK